MSDRAACTRKANFSEREATMVAQLIAQNYAGLYSTGKNNLPIVQKNAIWQSILDRVNSANGHNRCAEDLKKKWRDMKSRAKSKAATENLGGEVEWTEAEKIVLQTCEPETISGVGGRQVGAASLVRERHPEVAGTSSATAQSLPPPASAGCSHPPADDDDDDQYGYDELPLSADLYTGEQAITTLDIQHEDTEELTQIENMSQVRPEAASDRPEATAERHEAAAVTHEAAAVRHEAHRPRQQRQQQQLLGEFNVLSTTLIDCQQQFKDTLEGVRMDIRQHGERTNASIQQLNDTLQDVVSELHVLNRNMSERRLASSVVPSPSSSTLGSPIRNRPYPCPRRSPRRGPRVRGGKGTSRQL